MPNYTRKATRCSIDGCDAGGYMSRGLCKMHYARWLRHGETGGPAKQRAASWAGETCTVIECESPVRSLGYCNAHLKRLKRYGDPTISRPSTPAAERFAAKVTLSDSPDARPGLGPCHTWTAAIGNHGYGVFHPRKGESVLAHRWIYEQTFGPVPEGLVIDHLCRNRQCVNTAHLEPVTNEENLRRGAGYGLRNGMRKECIHGHEYTPENTYVDPTKGTVRCRACGRARDRARKRKEA